MLEAENQSLKAQLDWFKKQIFGQKPEKCLIVDNPDQASLLAGLGINTPPKVEPEKEEITDQGLRFDGSVPVERIELAPAGLNAQNKDDYEIIGEKITRRLAQHPGSYVVPEYVRPIIKHKASQQLATVPEPCRI